MTNGTYAYSPGVEPAVSNCSALWATFLRAHGSAQTSELDVIFTSESKMNWEGGK